MKLSDTERTVLWVGSAVAGVVHLAFPGLLLWLGGLAYRWFLRVEFDPKPGARGRVRLVGLGFLAIAAGLRRLLDR